MSEIIGEKGIEAFLAAEEAACLSLKTDNAVIATGGSAVYSEVSMAHLKSLGTIVYLEVDFNTLRLRLDDVRRRGVVLRDDQTLYDLYAERTPLYRRYADLTISEDGSLESTVRAVYASLMRDR